MYRTIQQIKEANHTFGHYWFSKDTLAFFGSEIHPKVYGGRYFITSEQCRWFDGQRLYSVRVANEKGEIDTVGKFQAYNSLQEAETAVKDILSNS